MNENYASLEASKRLVEKGIVLETNKGWLCDRLACTLEDTWRTRMYLIPAPSMAEVWRELPEDLKLVSLVRRRMEFEEDPRLVTHYLIELFRNMDRLVDLLIWVKENKHDSI